MTLAKYLIFMSISTFLCWGAWLLVVFYLDPENAGIVGLSVFYITLLFALTGALFFINFLWRRLFNQEAIVARQVGLSFRQAISFAIIFLGALYLQSQSLLNWLNIIFLILGLTVLEIFFVSRRQRA